MEDSPVDSEKPKDEGDITKVVAEHYNTLEEKGLEARKESRIYFMRNFNNWTKSILIGETISKVRDGDRRKEINVLDIGAGKGGDLLKWKKGNINHLVCADIAATSMEQCFDRYCEMKDRSRRQRDHGGPLFTLECIPADCTKIRLKDKFKDSEIKFDIVSCQFSFHYCFESLAQAKCMIKNASECLKPGGYFIGTTPNAYDLVKRLKESPDLTFGNEIYSATFKSKDNFPIFGTQYDFHLEGVVDCPEFLVYFPAFVDLAAQFGLKLSVKKTFEEFFEDNYQKGEGKFLLSKMNALETYPPFDGQDLVSKNDKDYENTKEKLKELKENRGERNYEREIRVGTLSKSEWEAVSLYLVFVFIKEDLKD